MAKTKSTQKYMTVSELLAYAATFTPAQLARLGLNVRADGTLSDHGCKGGEQWKKQQRNTSSGYTKS